MKDSHSPLRPKIVLGIVAHPDDMDVAAGGSVAQFVQNGAEVHYLILTDGSKGSDDVDMSSPELIKIRQDEQRRALEIVDGTSVTFLSYVDGELEVSMELKKDIVKVIRTIKPDVVITFDPTMVYSTKNGIINHPDHRAAGQATLDAVFPLARDRLAFPELAAEGFAPHKTPTVLLINFDGGNFAIDITNTFTTKVEVIRAHPSQFGEFEDTSWLRSMAEGQGSLYGYELAESFIRLDVR